MASPSPRAIASGMPAWIEAETAASSPRQAASIRAPYAGAAVPVTSVTAAASCTSTSAAGAGSERDLCAQPIHAGVLKLVERSRLRPCQQLERRIERAGVQLGVRR